MNITYFDNKQVVDFCINSTIEDLEQKLLELYRKQNNEQGERSKRHLGDGISTLEYIIEKRKEQVTKRENFSEIKIDYFDDDEKCWYVDVFETADENENGKVAAKYHESGRIFWVDEKFKGHPQILEEIKAFKKSLERR